MTASSQSPLTPEQRDAWTRDGYLILKGALSKGEVAALRKQVDRIHRLEKGTNTKKANARALDRRNILPYHDGFVDLIDHAAVFPVVLDLMGPYIQLSMAQVLVRPGGPRTKGYVHTDGGPALSRIRVTESSLPLQVKVQYFLTSVSGRDNGNFIVFPGSHYRPFPQGEPKPMPSDPGAVQLSAEAGDAALFPHALWHGVSPNRSRRSRKSLIYCYSQHCFRCFDFDGHDPDVLEKCTPRQRRLLGDLGRDWRPGAYFYSPKDQPEVMRRR